MSLLPPSLPSSAPAASGASSASSTSSPSLSRGEDAKQGDSESFGEVLSRSRAAGGEASTQAGGKPAASVAVKRRADENKPDPGEAANAAALLFVPLETRVAKTAAADANANADATDSQASLPLAASSSATPADLPADAGAAATQAAAAKDAGSAVGAEAHEAHEAQTRQALLTPDLSTPTAASNKDRALAAAQDAFANTASGDEASARPGRQATASSMAASTGGAAGGARPEPFPGREDRPEAEAREILGADTRAEQKPGSAQTAFTAADGVAAAGITTDTAQAAGLQRSGMDASVNNASVSMSQPAIPVQAHAASANAATQPSASQTVLTPEVGSHEWGKALGRQMLHMGQAGEQVAELQLNPPGLGPLKVTLSLSENQVQAFFVSAHSPVRAAIEAALPQLRSTLAESGLSLGNTSVDSGSQQQAFTFSQGQDSRPAPQERGQPGRPNYPAADATVLSPAAATGTAPRGKVDTYA